MLFRSLWLDYDCDWGNDNLIVWGYGHSRPSNWWHESSRQRDTGNATVWRSNNYPDAVGGNRGDRGYGVPNYRSGAATAGRSVSDSAVARQSSGQAARPETPTIRAAMPVTRTATPVVRPTPAPVQHSQPVSRPESSGAFIGIQSSQDARNYSNRGQQSIQTTTHSAPASYSAPVSRPAPSGGGGGGHSSGSQIKH